MVSASLVRVKVAARSTPSLKRKLRNVRVRIGSPKHEQYSTQTFFELAETVNGRAAMQGFIWGSLNEAMTGNNIREQLVSANPVGGYNIIPEDVLAAVSVIGLVVLGTSITALLPNEKLQKSSQRLAGPFTNDVEMLNGRVAMIGFLILSLMPYV